MLDSKLMRALACLAILLVPSLATAKAQPEPLRPLDRARLLALAPLLRGAELALIESTDQGHIKQLTTISYVRHRFMDTPFLAAAFQVVIGGVLVFLAGIAIGSS